MTVLDWICWNAAPEIVASVEEHHLLSFASLKPLPTYAKMPLIVLESTTLGITMISRKTNTGLHHAAYI